MLVILLNISHDLLVNRNDCSQMKNKNAWFVEESFAALIGIIFIYESFDKMIEISHQRPVRLNTLEILPDSCSCRSARGGIYRKSMASINVKIKIFENVLSTIIFFRIVLKIDRTNLLVVIVQIRIQLTSLMYSSSQWFCLLQHLCCLIHWKVSNLVDFYQWVYVFEYLRVFFSNEFVGILDSFENQRFWCCFSYIYKCSYWLYGRSWHTEITSSKKIRNYKTRSWLDYKSIQ